jgi:hypothetical protein
LEITIATRNGRALEHASTRAILSARVVIPFGYTLTIGLKPQRLAADAAYESGLMIGWLMRHGIEPHFPPLDQSPAICHNTRTATFYMLWFRTRRLFRIESHNAFLENCPRRCQIERMKLLGSLNLATRSA